MTTIPEPIARVTEYTVSCLPQDHPGHNHFSLTVAERGPGSWAVLRYGFCYDTTGNREYESTSTDRTDEFLARFRFPLDDALALAKRIAPTLNVNGYTVADFLARADA